MQWSVQTTAMITKLIQVKYQKLFLKGEKSTQVGSDIGYKNLTSRPLPTPLKKKRKKKKISLKDRKHIVVHINNRAQELCESRGGRPGLPSLIRLRFLWT